MLEFSKGMSKALLQNEFLHTLPPLNEGLSSSLIVFAEAFRMNVWEKDSKDSNLLFFHFLKHSSYLMFHAECVFLNLDGLKCYPRGLAHHFPMGV